MTGFRINLTIGPLAQVTTDVCRVERAHCVFETSCATGFVHACGTNPWGLYRIGFDSEGVKDSTEEAGSGNFELSRDSGTCCTPMTEILNGTNYYLCIG
jgi:hypothetical protein